MTIPRILVLAGLLLLTACASPRAHRDEWRPGVAKRTGTLVGDRQEGTWTYWYDSGAKEAEGGFRADKQDGAWTWWWPDGTPKQAGSYAAGLRTGRWTFRHPDGRLSAEGDYGAPGAGQPDRQHGLWRYWNSDGSLAAFGWFVDGRKELFWSLRDGAGHVSEEGLFTDGTPVLTWRVREGAGWREEERGAPAGRQAYRERGGAARSGLLALGRPAGPWIARPTGGPAVASADFAGAEHWLAWDESGPLGCGVRRDGRLVGVRFFAADGSELPSPTDPDAADPGSAWAKARARCETALAALRAPLTEVAREVPVADPLAGARALLGRWLAPQPELPGFWTPREEAGAGTVLATYRTGPQPDVGDYGWSSTPGRGGAAPKALLGRPLPQTRLLAADGRVIDLADRAARGRSVTLVVLRGFSGQVCVYCAAQTAALAEAAPRFADAKSDVVLVYPGPAESAPRFLAAVKSLGAELPPGVTLALDVDLHLVRGLGIESQLSKPSSFVLDRGGVVRWGYIGASLDDRPSAEDLLAQVARLP